MWRGHVICSAASRAAGKAQQQLSPRRVRAGGSSARRFSGAGKHQHRLKYAGSGKRRREEARRLARDLDDGAARDGSPATSNSLLGRAAGGGGQLLGWRPILFLGLMPLAAWLATVYAKPNLRKELIRSVTSGPIDDDQGNKPAESKSA
jgi:hypothetical protein